MNSILHFAESDASHPGKGAAKEQDKKTPVPDTTNSVANENTSTKQDEKTKDPVHMGSDVTPNEMNSSRNKPKPVPKDVVPETVKNGAANEMKSPDNETVPKEVVPDMVQNGVAKNTNSSLTQPKPVPKEVFTETVKDGLAKNTNTSNNNPKPSDPGLKPKPDDSQNVDPMKLLNPSPPAPPTPQCRTRAEWQKSNFFISSLSNVMASFKICTEVTD